MFSSFFSCFLSFSRMSISFFENKFLVFLHNNTKKGGVFMKKAKKYLKIYSIGAVGYTILEIIWRGYTHWTMSIVGGLCFSFIYKINSRFKSCKTSVKCLLGSGVITMIEFLSGVIINIVLKWNVWDYSRFRFNIKGQVCPLYSALWFVLCLPLTHFCKFLSEKIK